MTSLAPMDSHAAFCSELLKSDAYHDQQNSTCMDPLPLGTKWKTYTEICMFLCFHV